MKIKQVKKSHNSAYKSIKQSMNKKSDKILICNGLDACSCTGNGLC